VKHARLVGCVLGLVLVAVSGLTAEGPVGSFIGLPQKDHCRDLFLRKQVVLPEEKVVRAWTAITATHEFVLYVNGREACRSRFGRVPSAFRRAEEVEDLGSFFRPGANTLALHVRRWSEGVPSVFLRADVQYAARTGLPTVSIATDPTWLASRDAPAEWAEADFEPAGWQPVQVVPGDRLRPRIRRDEQALIAPEIPPPLPAVVLESLPQIAEMSDWRQHVVWRDLQADTTRLMKRFHTPFVARAYAKAIQRGNTHMGDSYSIHGYPVGNGLVFTTIGPWPFHNSTWTVGPEYQYPCQWNPGSTFGGDAVTLSVGGKPVALEDQWMWKIRGTDVVVTAATDRARTLVLTTLTFAPPRLKALLRIYAVANTCQTRFTDVAIVNSVHGASADGNRLVQTVKHIPIADARGDANVRRMITGALDDVQAAATTLEKPKRGVLRLRLGALVPGASRMCLVYHVATLDSLNGKPVKPDDKETLAVVNSRRYRLLDETIGYWRDYNATTTSLEAPGPWGRRTADFIDDVKMLVQVQQFERTGAVGPIWFFSDQWIRDACGPVKSFLRTGRFEAARRVLDYHYLSSIACRKILNWLPMDVGIAGPLPPVDDWSKITMNYADRHANCEVPSWIILQHYWYFQFTGDTQTIADHWGYLERCFTGQFDNPTDKVLRPDFKIPFHGDETYIYSGGEALWRDRYALTQTSYPGGNIHSADSSFELVAAGDALAAMARAIGRDADADRIAILAAKARQATERYYWMDDLGFYAQGMSRLFDGQLNRYPMANILANVVWSGYGSPTDPKTVSNALRMVEYLCEDSGVVNPIVGYDVTVGMLQGQALHTLAAINHPWAERAFHALLMIAGDTTEFSEWMAPGPDFRTVYRANRIRPWEAGINLDALLYYLTGFEPDAPARRFALTPRLPTGVYSPIRWHRMAVKHLPMGKGHFDLAVAQTERTSGGRRVYTLTSHSPDDVTVDLHALVPFARIRSIEIDGQAVRARSSDVFSQALATVPVPLPAGKTVAVAVHYRPRKARPVEVDLKPFVASKPSFPKSDIVVFTSLRPDPKRTLLRDELAKTRNVVMIDATLPTNPETFEAALLTRFGLRTQMLIMDEGTMASPQRKPSFWWNPRFDAILGTFLRRGGVVLEASSRNPSSKWLETTLAPARFQVDYQRGADVLALDATAPDLDRQFFWLDEKQAEACGKWSGYWAGNYTMRYIGGGPPITDRALIWGTQEQPHGCMQYTMKTTPGKDHLIRIRTWPRPRKGFTLQATEDGGKTWKLVETIWVPQLKDAKTNGWIDVFLTLPGKYVTKSPTVFRIGQPEGSSGGIGYAGHHSTGAARVWIRDNLGKPSSMANLATESPAAARLGLPGKGIVGYSSGRIDFTGFAAPYRILGDSSKAAVILRPVGRGLYVKSELTSHFPVERMAAFIHVLLDRSKRRAALADQF